MLDKNDILNRIDVLAYYSQYVKFEDNHGKNRKALCPFHAEESGSFYVEISTGRWYCQGACGTGGDLIAFHMRIKGLSFKDALRDLAAYTGVGDADIEEQEDQGIDIGQEAISIIEEINETESGEQGRKNKHDDTPHDSSANNEQNKTVFDSEDWSKYRESDQQKKNKKKAK
jgi:DNA primase